MRGKTQERLDRCRELEYILLGDVRDLLEDPFSAESRNWLRALIQTLLETLPEDFELCCAQGYLHEVLETYPDWGPLVERLEDRYSELLRQLMHFQSVLQQEEYCEKTADALRTNLSGWMSAFRAYRQHEEHLLALCGVVPR